MNAFYHDRLEPANSFGVGPWTFAPRSWSSSD